MRGQRITFAAIVIIAVFVFLLLSSAIMYEVEHEAQPNAFPNIPSAMWWGVVTKKVCPHCGKEIPL